MGNAPSDPIDCYPSGAADVELVKFDEADDSEEQEKARMINQARLAYWLRGATARRCEAQSSTVCSSETSGTRMRKTVDGIPVQLKMHAKQWVVKLTDIMILPRLGRFGTLEAHVNGFRYLTREFHVDLMHANVEVYLFSRDWSCLQFHLKHPIMVGDQLTKEILFKVPYRYRDMKRHRGEEVAEFVRDVQVTQWTSRSAPFEPVIFELLDEFVFRGTPRGGFGEKSEMCCLTESALVLSTPSPFFASSPFFVVPLHEIEIVNLARCVGETIDMTVVFKDYNRDVLEIGSIFLENLTRIKHGLNFAGVKYYVNGESRNWNNYVKQIAECPQRFKDMGGWDSLEDAYTLAYYPSGYADLYRKAPRDDSIELW